MSSLPHKSVGKKLRFYTFLFDSLRDTQAVALFIKLWMHILVW